MDTPMPQTRWLAGVWPERLTVALLALALSGCATERRPRPPEPGISRVYAMSQDALIARLREVLAGYQIEPGTYDPATGRLRAGRRDLGQTGWAMCQPLRVRDPDGVRLREAEPLRLDVDLGVQVEGVDGGTRVTLRPVFIETNLDSFTNLEVTHRCRSTGTLERDLLGALGAEGA
jgi:hypothetical protein